ncbi:MAG: FAD:protein FMN transferase [Bifidobacterium tsurumiense]|uniref:FAD:protein FMN transferase n=1 Tax=Bifidobacterium tsurumiense TaxID=356829 RepID=UPI002A838C85|nr:FAD:protein FMN transferase [Bifidobacterium tsurumiense]MDY4678520.1 FAD:protein FMN transferase [Bifidobacterium tsurumiense]
MSELTKQLPFVTAFPHAVGTGIILRTDQSIMPELREHLESLIDDMESALSRFRSDSIVARMAEAPQGGTFAFPDWTTGLFDLADALVTESKGAIDPCVGEDLIRLGYGSDLSFHMDADAPQHLGTLHGRPTWRNDIQRQHSTLITKQPVHLDFGAFGKGYLVDLIAEALQTWNGEHASPTTESTTPNTHQPPITQWIVDAGGDVNIHTIEPVTIALEDPSNADNAIGIIRMKNGSLCASSPSRRHWADNAPLPLHHLINALDGMPVTDTAASWALAPHIFDPQAGINTESETNRSLNPKLLCYPTALADGLATALFLGYGKHIMLSSHCSGATLDSQRHATIFNGFPGTFFLNDGQYASENTSDTM